MRRLKKRIKINVILDTTVYVASILSSNGASAEIFAQIINGEIFNFYTEEILEELKDVLNRPKFSLDKEKQEQFVHIIKEVSFLIKPIDKFKVKKCRDPTDDKFLSLANQINTGFIITLDHDLLSLKEFNRTKIITPSLFLQFIKRFK